MRLPLAVLIDAENIPAALFVPLREFVEALGEPIIWQLHGDLLPWSAQWQDIAQQHGLEMRQTFSGGKNSADIAMTTAAMDILHAGKVNGFCLVSSDSDFAPLARRLRADNMQVYGFGEPKTAESFRTACTEFHLLRQPLATKQKALPKIVAAKPATAKQPARPTATKPAARPVASSIDLNAEEFGLLRDILQTICRDHGGRVLISVAATYLRERSPELADRIGGVGRFLKNLEKLDMVDVHGDATRREISVKYAPLTAVP